MQTQPRIVYAMNYSLCAVKSAVIVEEQGISIAVSNCVLMVSKTPTHASPSHTPSTAVVADAVFESLNVPLLILIKSNILRCVVGHTWMCC
ncbi:MAG: hypothetical protein VX278_01190 [Myxococcota bacterium]|nr:hypothetical protein [Myxococcota bacterium]